jgi:hypothetical protein
MCEDKGEVALNDVHLISAEPVSVVAQLEKAL